MASELDYSQFDILIKTVLATTTKGARGAAVNAVLEYLVQTNVIDVWAESLANHFGYHNPTGREDVRSVIVEKLLVSLYAAQAGTTQRVKNWVDFLFGLSRNAVRDYLSSGQVTPAAGMSSATRRHNSIRIAYRELLTRLGREPSKQEIIDHANAHMLATRKNPKKQGALVTMEDFRSYPGTTTLDAAITLQPEQDGIAGADNRIAAGSAMRALLDGCANTYPDDTELAEVVGVWAQLHLEGERVTVMAVVNLTGFSRTYVRRGLERIDQVLATMRV